MGIHDRYERSYNADIRWRRFEDFTRCHDTEYLGVHVTTVHRCSRTLTYGHPSKIRPPGQMPLDSLL